MPRQNREEIGGGSTEKVMRNIGAIVFNSRPVAIGKRTARRFKHKFRSRNIPIMGIGPNQCRVDTPVCDVQTKKFNQEAANLGDDVEILTISMDLPFALKRYCAAEGIDKVKTVSDYMDASFGENYGVLIKENRLLARSIFVVDKDDKVRYVEIVPEIASEPNYAAAISAVKAAL